MLTSAGIACAQENAGNWQGLCNVALAPITSDRFPGAQMSQKVSVSSEGENSKYYPCFLVVGNIFQSTTLSFNLEKNLSIRPPCDQNCYTH